MAGENATLYRSWTAAAGNPLCDRLHPNMRETVLYALHSDTKTHTDALISSILTLHQDTVLVSAPMKRGKQQQDPKQEAHFSFF